MLSIMSPLPRTGFDGMKQRLQSKGMEFDSRQVPGGDLWQIFVDDPNGVMIELNYEAAKEGGCRRPSRRGKMSARGSIFGADTLYRRLPELNFRRSP